MKIQGLSSEMPFSLLFPLPPLAEQYRIVDAIVTLQPYTDAYADVESTLGHPKHRLSRTP